MFFFKGPMLPANSHETIPLMFVIFYFRSGGCGGGGGAT
jgi:hypothetical protein